MMILAVIVALSHLASQARAGCSSHDNSCSTCVQTTFTGIDFKSHNCKYAYIGPTTPPSKGALVDKKLFACLDYTSKRSGKKFVSGLRLLSDVGNAMSTKPAEGYSVRIALSEASCPKQNSDGTIKQALVTPKVLKQLRQAMDSGASVMRSGGMGSEWQDSEVADPGNLAVCELLEGVEAEFPGWLPRPGLTNAAPKIGEYSMVPAGDVNTAFGYGVKISQGLTEAAVTVGDLPGTFISAGVAMYTSKLMADLKIANARQVAIRSCFLLGCFAGTAEDEAITVNDPIYGTPLGSAECSLCTLSGLREGNPQTDPERGAIDNLKTVARAVCPSIGRESCWNSASSKWGDFIGAWNTFIQERTSKKQGRLESAATKLVDHVGSSCGGGGEAMFRQSHATSKSGHEQRSLRAE